MLKKFIVIVVFIFGLFLLLPSKILAAVDISLVDNPQDSTLKVIIDSNDEEILGIGLDIIYSENIVIKEINNLGDFCSMDFNSVASNGVLLIECLNNETTAIDDTLAIVEYSLDEEDYYFYVDEAKIDIGDQEVGTIQDVNRPEIANADTTEDNTPRLIARTEDGFLRNLIEFIREYYVYISLSVIVIVIFLLVSLFKKP